MTVKIFSLLYVISIRQVVLTKFAIDITCLSLYSVSVMVLRVKCSFPYFLK